MTSDTNQGQLGNNQHMPSLQVMAYPDDEIDLRDVFAILWRRRKLISLGVLLFVVAAVVIVFSMPDVYRVKALVRPGVVSREPGGKVNFTKRLDNYKGQIDAGVYNIRLERSLGEQFKGMDYSRGNLRVAIPKKSSAILITYDTTMHEFGKSVLTQLITFMKEEDSEILNSYIEELQSGIELNNNVLAEFEQQLDYYVAHINGLDNIKKDIQQKVITAQESAKKYRADGMRNLADSQKADDNPYKAILYNNMVVQNRQVIADLSKEVSDINNQIELAESKKRITSELFFQLLKDVDESTRAIKHISPFQEIIPVMVEKGTVGPKRFFIIVMSFIAGMFLMVVGAFTLEYRRVKL